MTASDQLVRALDARYYTDPDVFREEQDKLFARVWHFAGHVSLVENVGDYFTFDVAGQNLFCIRGNDDRVRCFYNVCAHRAHELVSESGSTRLLVCPYHSWTYELNGRLRGARNTKSVPGFNKNDICLTEVRLEDFHGFLFVNLSGTAPTMDEYYPGVRDELARYVPHIDRLKPLEWVEIEEKCNWKVSVENYSECYHCTVNHPAFARGVINPDTYDIQPQGHCLRHTTECQNLDQMSYDIDPNANDYATKYSSWFLWPTFSFQVYPGNILNTYHWRAGAADRVAVWRGWYTVDGVDSEVVRRLAVQDRSTTVEEDVALVESVQRGLRSRGYRPGPLVLSPTFGVNSEHSLQALHTWVREALDDA